MKSAATLLGALCALAAALAHAQAYPSKPIRIIVPFAAGGPTDTHSRWAAQQLNAAFGQAVVVDNRGGAGGVMQKMRCPFLLVHGADDEQIPLADAKRQFDACGSRDKTFRVFTAEEGGAQHCQRDYLTLVTAEMWNWFEEKLVRT